MTAAPDSATTRRAARKITVALIIPVLNEATSMPHILPKINPSWVDEIIFVDGGSKDRTMEVIKEWGHGEVFVQKKKGLAEAYFEAFERIKSDYVIAFSPDGNSVPEKIPELVQKASEGYDMVIGSRYLAGAGSEDDDFFTTIGNRIFTLTINILFGGRYSDSLVMFRIYRKTIVKEMEMKPRIHCFEPQLAIRCAVHGMKTTEIPAKEPPRIGDERKMRVVENGWAILKMIFSEWFRFLRLKIAGKV